MNEATKQWREQIAKEQKGRPIYKIEEEKKEPKAEKEKEKDRYLEVLLLVVLFAVLFN